MTVIISHDISHPIWQVQMEKNATGNMQVFQCCMHELIDGLQGDEVISWQWVLETHWMMLYVIMTAT